MRETEGAQVPEGLERLQRQVEAWRRSPTRSKVMPAELWDAATAATGLFGTSRVARALGVNYQRLKAQMDLRDGSRSRTGGTRRAAEHRAPQVVDAVQFVDMGRLAGIAPPVGPDELLVEMIAADGTRLTIRARQASPAVLELVNAFCDRVRR
jgi:hypothetical protein